MEKFTYFELLMLNELVVREQKKIGKQVYCDFCRCFNKILRPGLFKRMQTLLELERKLNHLGKEARERVE